MILAGNTYISSPIVKISPSPDERKRPSCRVATPAVSTASVTLVLMDAELCRSEEEDLLEDVGLDIVFLVVALVVVVVVGAVVGGFSNSAVKKKKKMLIRSDRYIHNK